MDVTIDNRNTIPSGYELIRELMAGAKQADLARKYDCSPQNINNKIEYVVRKLDPEFRQQYLRDNIPILKSVEALHIQESINPDRIKKMSSYQLTGMAKLIWEMRRTEEGKTTEIHANMSLIADVNELLNQLECVK